MSSRLIENGLSQSSRSHRPTWDWQFAARVAAFSETLPSHGISLWQNGYGDLWKAWIIFIAITSSLRDSLTRNLSNNLISLLAIPSQRLQKNNNNLLNMLKYSYLATWTLFLCSFSAVWKAVNLRTLEYSSEGKSPRYLSEEVFFCFATMWKHTNSFVFLLLPATDMKTMIIKKLFGNRLIECCSG